MPLHFVTKDDHPHSVDFPGLGVLHANGKGPGISVKQAATVLSPLQEKHEDGSLKTQPDGAGNPVATPLTGNALAAAAKAFCENFQGGTVVTTVNRSDEENAAKRQEVGGTPDRPPLNEIAEQEYAFAYADLEAVNDEPASPAQITGAASAGGLSPSTPPGPAEGGKEN